MTQRRRKGPAHRVYPIRDPIAYREKRVDAIAREWLEENAPNPKPMPKSQPIPLERWQIRLRAQKQERRVLAKPLLKGVE